MDVFLLLLLVACSVFLGVMGALDYMKGHRPEREAALVAQLEALRSAQALSIEAWQARWERWATERQALGRAAQVEQVENAKTRAQVVSVFVPTTPNPTTGFLILVPESSLTKLDMSVADGIKFIMSLGSVAPDYVPLGGAAIVNGSRVVGETPGLGDGGVVPALAASVPSPAGARAASPGTGVPQN